MKFHVYLTRKISANLLYRLIQFYKLFLTVIIAIYSQVCFYDFFFSTCARLAFFLYEFVLYLTNFVFKSFALAFKMSLLPSKTIKAGDQAGKMQLL